MTDKQQQPEALRLAEILEGGYSLAWLYERGGYGVSAELRRQHARITELESQLAQRFDAADMATAPAQQVVAYAAQQAPRDAESELEMTQQFNAGRSRAPHAMTREQQKALIALLKEARSIIRASSSRQLVKDWDTRATQALKAAKYSLT